MFTRKTLAAGIGIAFGSVAIAADAPKLGKPITEADIAAWDIAIMPDGTGLPPGGGTAVQGATIYAAKCLACHAENGKGGGAPGAVALAGGAPRTSGIDPP
jgi:cytochrome c